MTQPFVSCLCPTFARVHLLEEAIESFLRQDYTGQSELIVCNDFTQQELQFDHPNIKVINVPSRYATLGEKRNATASHARGDFLLTWGDDDIHLPNRISRMVNFVLGSGHPFALEGPHFCLAHTGIRRHTHSTAGAHIVYRNLYNRVGGVPHLDSGEDISFNGKMHEYFGRSVPCCGSPPAFIYRWHSNRPHVSGVGRERPYEKMAKLAESLVEKGEEPKGVVTLNPAWSKDWVEFAATAQP